MPRQGGYAAATGRHSGKGECGGHGPNRPGQFQVCKVSCTQCEVPRPRPGAPPAPGAHAAGRGEQTRWILQSPPTARPCVPARGSRTARGATRGIDGPRSAAQRTRAEVSRSGHEHAIRRTSRLRPDSMPLDVVIGGSAGHMKLIVSGLLVALLAAPAHCHDRSGAGGVHPEARAGEPPLGLPRGRVSQGTGDLVVCAPEGGVGETLRQPGRPDAPRRGDGPCGQALGDLPGARGCRSRSVVRRSDRGHRGLRSTGSGCGSRPVSGASRSCRPAAPTP